MKYIASLRVAVSRAAAFVLFPLCMSAQQPIPPPDATIDNATRTAVIDSLVKQLNEAYVFPEVAKKMEADLRARQSRNEYDSFTSAVGFSSKLTEDLQSVSKDKHLRVRFSAQPIPVRAERGEPTEAEKAENRWFNQRINYGFEKVERMNGNVGYIDLRNFNDHEAGAETVAAALTFVSNTDALIFDLRQNFAASNLS